MTKLYVLFTISAIFIFNAFQTHAGPKELGDVKWLRNYDAAIAQSKAEDKPILLLFQEVPGCQGCVNFGETTLRHPLIVDAIENHFIPVAIYNNKGGEDRKILKKFEEPSWNFQVMRFINSDEKDIIPRKDKVWTPEETASRIIEALEAYGKVAPEYLKTVAWSGNQDALKTAAFSMWCFWDGEAKLGGIDGVVNTEAGWLDGREVVLLNYDPGIVKWDSLVKQARSHGCANNIYAPDTVALKETPSVGQKKTKLLVKEDYRAARASDQKRHISFSKFKQFPLNPIQKTKINAALSQNDPDTILKWLSPSQRSSLKKEI